MSRVSDLIYAYSKWQNIRIADNGKTLVIDGSQKEVEDLARDIRKLQVGGYFLKVRFVKVYGFNIELLRRALGIKFFDDMFDVQAEYVPSMLNYIIVRSTKPSLPIGAYLVFRSPPLHIRPKMVDKKP